MVLGVLVVVGISALLYFLGMRVVIGAFFLGFVLMSGSFFVHPEAAFMLFLPGIFLVISSLLTGIIIFLINRFYSF